VGGKILKNKNQIFYTYVIPFLSQLLSRLGLLDRARMITLRRIKRYQDKYYMRHLLPRVKEYPEQKKTVKTVGSVLHINSCDVVGGAALLAYNLSKRLNDNGIDSRLIVAKKYSQDERVEVMPQSKSISQMILNQSIWLKVEWDGLYRSATFKIKENNNFKKADVIHLHNIHGGYFSRFFLPELASLKPVVWTLHDIQELAAPCGKLVNCDHHELCKHNGCPHFSGKIPSDRAFFLWKNKRNIYHISAIRRIICPSHWLKERAKNSNLEGKDIHVIHNGIDTGIFKRSDQDAARKMLALPPDKNILLFIAQGGVSIDAKGGCLFQDIYNRLKTRKDLFFITIGGNGTRKTDNWREIPYLYDSEMLARYYSAADLFVYPTKADVFGLVVAESISCGTPVITFSVGGIPEIVDHMVTGYLAREGDLKDLMYGIDLFLTNSQLRTWTADKGPEIVKSNFSLEKMTREYIKVYNEAIEDPKIQNTIQKRAHATPIPGCTKVSLDQMSNISCRK
jgi:glycosyltransferase involved in cell wall biosynthesis